MYAFLEATWFLWWILTVIGVLRWFHNASEFDDRINSRDGRRDSQMLVLQRTALENQPNSEAS